MKIERRQWKWLAGGISAVALLVLITWGWHSLQAQPMGGYRGGMLGLGRMLHDLDLTPDQKKQLAQILRSHKSELLQARDKMSQAGRAMLESIGDQDARAEALQARVDAAAEAGKQLGHVMIGVRKEVVAILTPQQKQELAQRHQHFVARLERHLHDNQQDREQALDEWIDRLSK